MTQIQFQNSFLVMLPCSSSTENDKYNYFKRYYFYLLLCVALLHWIVERWEQSWSKTSHLYILKLNSALGLYLYSAVLIFRTFYLTRLVLDLLNKKE